MHTLFTSLARLLARRPLTVLVVALLLTMASALLALRVEVKTSFKDTMSRDEPYVARLDYMSDNFPGAITVLAVVEGRDQDRLVEVARALEQGFLADEELVRAVYLEQDLDFFVRRALLYLPEEDLRVAHETLAAHEASLQRLLQDPSVLGLLRAVEEMGQGTFAAGDAVFTLSTQVFGDVLWDELARGRPAAELGVRVDTAPLGRRLSRRTLDTLERAPMPPSDARAREILSVARDLFALVADVLERGERIEPEVFQRRVERLRALDLGGNAGLPPRYRISEGGDMLLLEIAGAKDVTQLENIAPLLQHLEAVRDRVAKDNPDVKIGLTGMPVLYQQEQSAILDNFALVSVLGLLGILAVFIIGFERVGLPSLAVVPLVMGVLWTIGVQGLVRPELNMLNLLFPVLLFGLGIDFAIHLLSGYAERRSAGDGAEESLVHVFTTVVPGLITGALTTSVAFLILLLASLKGLRELGFTAGVGVLMSLISMLTVLPALLVLWDGRQKGKGQPIPSVPFVFLERVGAFCQRSRYGVLAVFLALTIALAYFVPRVDIDRDALRLQPVGMPAAVLQQRVLEAFRVNGEPSVFFAKDLEEADRIYRAAKQARTLADPVSITMAIPDGQAEKAPLIGRIRERIEAIAPGAPPRAHEYDEAQIAELRRRLAGIKAALLELSALAAVLYGEDTERLVGELRDQVNRIDRRLVPASAEHLMYLDRLLSVELQHTASIFLDMARNTEVKVDDLPRDLVDRGRGKDGSWMVLVRANGYVFDADFLQTHVAELESIHPEVTGLVPVWKRMLEKILDDIPWLTGLTVFAVALLVLLGLRSVRGTVLSLVPMVIGMVWTLGLLGLLGVDLNFVSLLAIPLIVGIGIDDGVHLYHRIRHERALGPALAHSGKAVILTSLTTGIGFGSLLLSVHRGVFYLGLTTTLGVLVCLVISLFLLPALVAIFQEDLLGGEPDEEHAP